MQNPPQPCSNTPRLLDVQAAAPTPGHWIMRSCLQAAIRTDCFHNLQRALNIHSPGANGSCTHPLKPQTGPTKHIYDQTVAPKGCFIIIRSLPQESFCHQ